MVNDPGVTELESEDNFDPSQNEDLVALRDAVNGEIDDRFNLEMTDAMGDPDFDIEIAEIAASGALEWEEPS